MNEEVRHRLTIDIRRKGSPDITGIEIKTEHFSSIQEILDTIEQFMLDTFEYEEEQIFEQIYEDGSDES